VTDQVTIDGSTQPGASCDPRVLLIEISGENIDHNNLNNGIQLTDGSSNSIVKGLVINRFTYSGDEDILAGVGVLINGDSGSNTIVCNHVGSNADGNSAFGNTMGVGVVNGSGLNNLIGGFTSADRNLVSGNSIGIGVLDSTAVTVVGNYVGTDITGDNSLRNSYGVYVIAQTITSLNLQLGGTSAGAGNVISGNYYNVAISATDVEIQGNYVGTNAGGSDRIITIDGGENSIGLYIVNGQNINIGGTAIGARNIISGNGYGMNIGGDNPVSNLSVAGNYIGPNADGSACLGSGIVGIIMGNVNNIVIGGNSAAARNVISCQTYSGAGYGIAFSANGTSQDNTIQGNYIGTNITGQISSGFGNVGEGIVLANVSGSLIGGSGLGEGNVIAGNGRAGVAVTGGTVNLGNPDLNQSINNSIIGNSIFGNDGLGIDLTINDVAGVTPNDAGDPDYGPNHLMNYPVISSVTSSNGQATITYDLDIYDAEPGASGYRVEFFANDSDDPSGHGQGQTYLGSDTVSGDVTGQEITITLPNGVDGSKYITATATMTDASDDGFGHTSEFAENVQATLVAAVSDDNDGITSQVENAAPNSGDANNDGTPDSEQSNVASFVNSVNSEYAVLEVSEDCSITSASIDSESSTTKDPDFSYPTGLMDFTLDCGTNGFTADITQYYYGQDSSDFIVRKYNPTTKTYTTIDGASISNTNIDSNSVTKASYQVKDGGSLDLDNTTDGSIHDPAGLAQTTDSLADTGQNITPIVLLATILLTSGLAVSTYTYNNHSDKQRNHNA
jgi:hypothetical protein